MNMDECPLCKKESSAGENYDATTKPKGPEVESPRTAGPDDKPDARIVQVAETEAAELERQFDNAAWQRDVDRLRVTEQRLAVVKAALGACVKAIEIIAPLATGPHGDSAMDNMALNAIYEAAEAAQKSARGWPTSEAFRLGAQAQRARDLSICHNEFRKDPNNARLAVCADRISRADIVTQQDQLMAMP